MTPEGHAGSFDLVRTGELGIRETGRSSGVLNRIFRQRRDEIEKRWRYVVVVDETEGQGDCPGSVGSRRPVLRSRDGNARRFSGFFPAPKQAECTAAASLGGGLSGSLSRRGPGGFLLSGRPRRVCRRCRRDVVPGG